MCLDFPYPSLQRAIQRPLQLTLLTKDIIRPVSIACKNVVLGANISGIIHVVYGPVSPMDRQSVTKAVVLNQAAIDEQAEEAYAEHSRGKGVTWKTLVSSTRTSTDSLTSGIATCAPQDGCLCVHTHQQAELYHFIAGEGVVEIAGTKHYVEKGSVVFIPGYSEHGVMNTSKTQPLVWLYVFATDDFGDVHYQYLDHRKVVDGSPSASVELP